MWEGEREVKRAGLDFFQLFVCLSLKVSAHGYWVLLLLGLWQGNYVGREHVAERKQSRGQDTSQRMLPMMYFLQVVSTFQLFHNLPVTIKLGTYQWINPFMKDKPCASIISPEPVS